MTDVNAVSFEVWGTEVCPKCKKAIQKIKDKGWKVTKVSFKDKDDFDNKLIELWRKDNFKAIEISHMYAWQVGELPVILMNEFAMTLEDFEDLF